MPRFHDLFRMYRPLVSRIFVAVRAFVDLSTVRKGTAHYVLRTQSSAARQVTNLALGCYVGGGLLRHRLCIDSTG